MGTTRSHTSGHVRHDLRTEKKIIRRNYTSSVSSLRPTTSQSSEEVSLKLKKDSGAYILYVQEVVPHFTQ